MITFQPINLAHREMILRYTLGSERRNCDLSFANLMSWRFLYLTEVAELDGFLLFRFYVDGQLMYMMPLGEGPLRPVILALMEDAQRQQAEFRMAGVCTELVPLIEAEFPGVFRFTGNRDYADYVYLRSDLATLRGKKLQPKRNHVHRFEALYPDYEYLPLTPDRVGECLQLEELWRRENGAAEKFALDAERRSMTFALQHLEELGIKGGVLHAAGRPVAFTYGAPINAVTWDTCVEKADTEVEGAYAMINLLYAQHLDDQYLYINREEDLGLEGLRRAKLSYHPETLLDKMMCTLK
jgi:hypothetical protein